MYDILNIVMNILGTEDMFYLILTNHTF